eukprot:10257870-Alexandrium_andersonii.AAC.1
MPHTTLAALGSRRPSCAPGRVLERGPSSQGSGHPAEAEAEGFWKKGSASILEERAELLMAVDQGA